MKTKESFILKLYKSKETVFTFPEIALLFRESNKNTLKAKLNYYVKKGVIKNIRRGIYIKEDYNPFEMATKIYTPSYISFETVLQKEGIIFQHYETIFVVSYLNRKIETDDREIQYRRIKEEILLSNEGILNKETYFIASKERAFLDCLYLYKDYYFDNLKDLDKKKILSLVNIYRTKKLTERVKNILKYV